ncbi:MAG: hypothetical protein E7641_01585 [Ruminococcaceae bacterium]|nr:hypothetical protein [Oscillospiraceae bacterium]
MKIIAVILALLMLTQIFSVSILAAETGNGEESSVIVYDDIGEISSCLYSASDKKVTISGRINHDIMVTHSDYKLAVYRLEHTQSLEEVVLDPQVKPVATASISIKFEFAVKDDGNNERFSRYAVVIYNQRGDIKPIGEPVYPSVTSKYSFEKGDKSYYKGAMTELTSAAINANVSTSVIRISLDKLMSDGSTGYLYSMQDSYIYFDKEYIGELDAKIKSLTTTDSKVYLQFLLSSTPEGSVDTLVGSNLTDTAVPDMRSPQTVSLVAAFTDFLCERYSNSSRGRVSGIILGERVDDFFSDNVMGLSEYAENYAYYMLVVGGVARSSSSEMDIVMPFGDTDAYSANAKTRVSAELLEVVCAFYDGYLANEFPFSTMIETASLPYGISNETIANGKFSSVKYSGINADRAAVYSEYLASVAEKYSNAPRHFTFMWSVPKNISGNELTAAYSYSYFKLLGNDMLSSFVISFNSSEKLQDYSLFPEIMKIMKYIDTAESQNVTKPQLDILRASSWRDVISDIYSGKTDTARIISIVKQDSVPADNVGSFDYFDFSYYTNISSWFGGTGCTSLKIDYGNICGRSLMATFNGESLGPTEYSELYCYYDYPENFAFTTDIAITLGIENDSADKGAIYEVKIVFGMDNNISEATAVCNAYEKTTVILDIAEFCNLSMADYVMIGVRELTDTEGGFTLSLSSVTGYSSEFLSDELESKITEERLRIRNMLDEESEQNEEEKSANTILIVVGVSIIVIVIGIGVFMCIRREEE